MIALKRFSRRRHATVRIYEGTLDAPADRFASPSHLPSRRRLRPALCVAAAACALLLSPGGRSVFAQDTQPAKSNGLTVVREAFPSKFGGFWPNFVARDKGFYAKEGIDFQEVQMDPNITVSSLIGNAVEIAYADSTQLLFAVQKHQPLLAVGMSTDKQPYKLMSSPSIKTIRELKGQRIGAASEIDIYTYVIKQILLKGGLDPDRDVLMTYGGNQNHRLSAIIGGAIQGGLFSLPSDSRLTSLGFHTLAFTPDYFPNLTLSAETVRRDWAMQHGDTLRAVLRAESEAVKWLNDPANKAEAISILQKSIGSGAADAEASYDYFIGKHVWTDACIHRPGLVNVVKIMRITKQLQTVTEADVPKFADPEFCVK